MVQMQPLSQGVHSTDLALGYTGIFRLVLVREEHPSVAGVYSSASGEGLLLYPT